MSKYQYTENVEVSGFGGGYARCLPKNGSNRDGMARQTQRSQPNILTNLKMLMG